MQNFSFRKLLVLVLAIVLGSSAVFGQLKSGLNAPHCAFTGTLEVGDTLFFNTLDTALAHHNLNFQWYRCNDDTGTGRQSIAGAVDSIYILQEADSGKYIQLGVSPQGGFYNGQEIRSAIHGKVYHQLKFFLSHPGLTAPFAFRLRPEDIPANSPFQLNTQSLGLIIPQLSGAYPNGDDVYFYGLIQPKVQDDKLRSYGGYLDIWRSNYEFKLGVYTKAASDSQYARVLIISGQLNIAANSGYRSGDPTDQVGMTVSSVSFNGLTADASTSTIGVVNSFLLNFKLNLAAIGITTAINTKIDSNRYRLQAELRDQDFPKFWVHDLDDIRFMDLFAKGGWFTLANDIDASETRNWNNGKGFRPLLSRFYAGESSVLNLSSMPWGAELEGNGHVIDGLYINRPDEDSVGFYKTMRTDILKDIGFTNATVIGRNHVGIISGDLESTSEVRKVFTSGRVSGNDFVGSLSGAAVRNYNLNLKQVYSVATVEANGSNSGLLLGASADTVSLDEVYTVTENSNQNAFVGPAQYLRDTNSYFNSDSISSSPFGIGRNTMQLRNPANYNFWDFSQDWAQSPFLNNGFPILRSFIGPLDAQIAALSKPQCDGDSNGQLKIEVLSGTPPFNFKWDNGDTSQQSQNRAAGTISAWVYDGIGDSLQVTFNLNNEDTIAPAFNLEDVYTLYSDQSGQAQFDTAIVGGAATDNCALDSVWLNLDTLNCNTTASSLVPAAMPFDGFSASATVPNQPDFNFSQGVISMWVKPEARNANSGIVALRGTSSRFSFHLNQGLSELGLWNDVSYNTVSYPKGFEAGKWYHLMFVIDHGRHNPVVYVDGDSIGSFSNNINTSFANEDFRIGFSGSGEHFKGEIAQVAVFDSLLNAQDFGRLPNLGWYGDLPHLLAYYPMFDRNSTLNDFGPNAFDGSYAGINPSQDIVSYAPYIRFNARDEAGNISLDSAYLILRDTIAPEFISCPGNISLNPDSAGCGAIVNYTMPVADDNCQIDTLVMLSGLASGSRFPAGFTEINFEARDASGNRSICSFMVEVLDSVAPTFENKTDTTIYSSSNNCGRYFFHQIPEASDNCPAGNPTTLSQTAIATNTSLDYTGRSSAYARIFDLGQEGVDNDYHLSEIKYGVYSFVSNELVKVNIYLYSELRGGSLATNDLSGLRSELSRYAEPLVTLTDSLNSYTSNIRSLPVDLNLPSGSRIVVELITPNHDFFMGGNSDKNAETRNGWMTTLGGSYVIPSYDFCPLIFIEGEENRNVKRQQISGPLSGAFLSNGSYELKFQVEDNSGNVDSLSYTVNVLDTIPPTVYSSTLNYDLENGSLECGRAIEINSLESYFYDGCGLDTIIQVEGLALDTIFPLGQSLCKLLAYDLAGNVSDTLYLTINILDRAGPIAQLKKEVDLYLDANGMASLNGVEIDSASYDVCNSVDTIIPQRLQFSCNETKGFISDELGFGYLSLDGVDDYVELDSSIFSSLTQFSQYTINLYYRDATEDSVFDSNPSLIGSGLISAGNDSSSTLSAYVSNEVIMVNDDSSNFRPIPLPNPGPRWHNLRIIRVNPAFTAIFVDASALLFYNYNTDLSGNNIKVLIGKAIEAVTGGRSRSHFKGDIDELKIWTGVVTPQNQAQASNNLLAHFDFNEGSGQYIYNRVSDSIGGQLINVDTNTAWTDGTNKISVALYDTLGNLNLGSMRINVLDSIAPQVYVKNPSFYLDSTGYITINTTSLVDSVNDNCGIDTVYIDRDTIDCSSVGSTPVVVSALDLNGNLTEQIVNVQLMDTIKPVVRSRMVSLFLDENGQASLSAMEADNGTYDPNCSIDSLYLSKTEFNCNDLGTPTVYLFAEDAAGNRDSSLVMLSVQDTIVPQILTKNATLYLDGNGQANLQVSDIDSGSSKTCGNLNLDISQNQFDCSDIGSNSIWLYADDGLGNRDSAMALVLVLDTLKPLISAQNQSLYLDANGQASLGINMVDNGSSDNCGLQVLRLSDSTFNCSNLGPNQLYLIAEDVNGNRDSASFTVNIIDSIRPNAQARNVVLYLDQNGMASLSASQVSLASGGNCPTNSTLSQTIFSCADEGLNLEQLTISDAAGNADSASFLVEVRDTIRPSIIAKNITVQLGASGQASIAASQLDSASSDNCSNQLFFNVSKSSFNCSNLGLNTVTLSATDGQGNSRSTTAQILVEDNILPIARGRNLNVYLDANGQASLSAAQVDNGSSDNCSIDSLALSKVTFDCSDLGSNTIQLSVFDQSGNESSSSVVVTVLDTISPQVQTQGINVYLNAIGQASITAAEIDNGSSDNCGISSYSIDKSAFVCSDLGSQPIVFTATDAQGNSRSTAVTIQVLDTISPTVPAGSLSLSLDANGNASLNPGMINTNASDNCGIQSWSLSKSNFSCADLGLNTVSLGATDLAGNVTTANWTITIEDQQSPTVLTQNVTVYLDANGNASLSANDVDAGSGDNCAIQSLSLSASSFDCSDIGSNVLNLTAEDASGNSQSASFIATVIDTMAPMLNLQAVNVYLDANGQATLNAVDLDNGSFDNCGIQDMSLSASSFDCTDLGTQNITVTATDVNGNSRSQVLSLQILDTIAPQLPGGTISVALDASGSASISVNMLNANAGDNCGVSNWSLSKTTFNCSEVGANTVQLSATDASGNSRIANYTINVLDQLPPVLNVQNLTVYLDANGLRAVLPSELDNGSFDNCMIASRTLDIDTFDCADLGQNLVTFTATDVHGNQASQNVIITVLDTISPSFVNVPGNITAYTTAGQCEAIVQWPTITGTDNCGNTSLSTSATNGGLFSKGISTVNVQLSDANGNSINTSFTVTVLDTISPQISSIPQVFNISPNPNSCDATVTWIPPVASDNCAVTSFSSNFSPGATLPVGTTTIVYTATDAEGNSSSRSFDVVVTDNIKPQITNVPGTIVQANDPGQCGANVSWSLPQESDNCGVLSFTSSHNPGDFFTVGTTTVSYTATDAAGNQSVASFEVRVEDQEKPQISAMPLNDTVGQCSAAYTYNLPVASDNCSGLSIQQISGLPSGNVFPVGITQNTFRISDAAGNDTVVGFTVLVVPQGQAQLPDLLEICANAPAVDISEGQANIVWTGDGVINSTTFDPSVAGTGRKTLSYVYTDSYGCTVSGSIIVTVLPVPASPQIVQVASNTLATTQTYSSYQWYRDGILIPGATNQNYSYTQSGHYQVMVGNTSGCTLYGPGYAIGPINGGIGLEEFDWSRMALYPNPSNGQFTLHFGGIDDEHVQIEVLATDGRLVYKSSQKINLEGLIQIDLRGMAKAVYYLRVKTKHGLATRKLIIE